MDIFSQTPVQPVFFLQSAPGDGSRLGTTQELVNSGMHLLEHGREWSHISTKAGVHRTDEWEVEIFRCHCEKITHIVIHRGIGIWVILQMQV